MIGILQASGFSKPVRKRLKNRSFKKATFEDDDEAMKMNNRLPKKVRFEGDREAVREAMDDDNCDRPALNTRHFELID
jgi:hypothetical protein